MPLTPDQIARAIELASALLSEAPGFPDGPRDAAALDVLAAAIADRDVILQADVLERIREAWERAGATPPKKLARLEPPR